MPSTVNTLTLPNGLRVAHIHDKATSMVALSVLYNTGARDESPRLTGIAHLMEHLMFAGSPNVPDFDEALQRAGGVNNAWTSNDFTCFYEVAPAHNAETLFWIESDRMLDLTFSQQKLEVQRKVVVEEFYQQCLNQPYGDLSHNVRELAYNVHPYRWPVIGLKPEHIMSATLDDIKDYYYSHYSPSNAVMAVVGDISWDTVRSYALKWFGTIPARPVKPRELPEEPTPEEARQRVLTGPVPSTLISMNFLMDSYGTRRYYTADLISDIMSSGRSAILHRDLVKGTDLFDMVDASITGSEHRGLFNITALLRRGVDSNEAIDVIWKELDKFKADEISPLDLQRALNRMESNRVFENLGTKARALNLALAHFHAEHPETSMENYRNITPADIRQEAQELLDPRRAITVTYMSQ